MKSYRLLLFFLIILTCNDVEGKERICLNMIVKNESQVIERALESVKELIDYWVIVDTGSTDGTQEVIKSALQGIPGDLYERPWVDFSHNRNEALILAKTKGEYILFLDADDQLFFQNDFQLPKLEYDMYEVRWVHKNQSLSYFKPQLVKSTLPWEWKGVMHEYLTCNLPYTKQKLYSVEYRFGGDGNRSQDPEKYLKAVKILEQALEEEPENTRYAFYLAESLRDAGKYKEAITQYEKRANLGGWEEEVYWSLLQAACLKEQMGELDDTVIESYYRAHRFRPYRVEPIYYLSQIYNRLKKFDLAYGCIKGWEAIPQPDNKDILFKVDWIEEFALKFQLSLSAYYLNKHAEFVSLCDHLLAIETLPENYRKQVMYNKEFVSFAENKSVFIAILARNKAHLLSTFLKCIENLDYDKKLITIYINTNNNVDSTQQILEEWVSKNASFYHAIVFESHEISKMEETRPHEWNPNRWKLLGGIRNRSIQKAISFGCDYYFSVDCDNFIAPFTLKELIAKDKPIVAPLLKPIPHFSETYANFFADVDKKGYYKHREDYYNILYRRQQGIFKVPVVHQVYLIHSKYLDRLNYLDDTQDWEFIVFSRCARANQIDQFICNDRDYGYFLHFSENLSLTEEQEQWNAIAQNFERPGILSSISDLHELPGNLFQQAQNYKQNFAYDEAIRLYEKAADIATKVDEKYDSLLQAARLKEILKRPVSEVIASYLKVFQLDSNNSEPLYYLSQYYRKKGLFKISYHVAKEALKLSSTRCKWIDEYGMLWEFSLAAHNIGNFQESVDTINQLLLLKNLDENTQHILKRNLSYSISGIVAFEHAYKCWGPPPWEEETSVEQLFEPIKQPSQTSLHICTMASDRTKNLNQLVDSCVYFGHQLDILGLNEPFSFGKKLRDYKKYIDTIPDDDVVMCIDAYDVLLLADEKTILDRFFSLNAPVVFSVETNCHPYPHLADHFPKTESKFKYLNSGSFIGYAGYLKKILASCADLPDEMDDQGLMSIYFLYHKNQIRLDYETEIFLTLLDVDISELKFNCLNKNLFYSQFGVSPCVIHGNSTGKQLYQEIYNHFFNIQNPLEGRIFSDDKRYPTFKLAFDLLKERDLKIIVETGTARGGIHNFRGDGGSTILFSDWCCHHPGSRFYSVDINSDNLAAAQLAVGENSSSNFICTDSVHFLKNFPDQIDFLYLDSVDFDFQNPEISQQHHLKEIQAAYDKLSQDSIVMIDDCHLPHGGKGKLVIEYLLERDWKIMSKGYQVLLCRLP